MRMQTLHVHDSFIFDGFEFRQVGVYRCCFSRVCVHMEKRGIEHRQKKGGYRAARRELSHSRILMRPRFEVKPPVSEEFLKFL